MMHCCEPHSKAGETPRKDLFHRLSQKLHLSICQKHEESLKLLGDHRE